MADARDTLSALIDAAGVSIAEFSRVVLGRDERTVRRWLAGETIPASAASWLQRVESIDVTSRSVTLRARR